MCLWDPWGGTYFTCLDCLEKKFGLQKAILRYYDGISFVVQTSVSAIVQLLL